MAVRSAAASASRPSWHKSTPSSTFAARRLEASLWFPESSAVTLAAARRSRSTAFRSSGPDARRFVIRAAAKSAVAGSRDAARARLASSLVPSAARNARSASRARLASADRFVASARTRSTRRSRSSGSARRRRRTQPPGSTRHQPPGPSPSEGPMPAHMNDTVEEMWFREKRSVGFFFGGNARGTEGDCPYGSYRKKVRESLGKTPLAAECVSTHFTPRDRRSVTRRGREHLSKSAGMIIPVRCFTCGKVRGPPADHDPTRAGPRLFLRRAPRDGVGTRVLARASAPRTPRAREAHSRL